MPRQWDIVEVPGTVWPAEGSDENFLAVIVSSQFASEKANIYWVCPIRSSAGKRVEVGFVPVKQYLPPRARLRSEDDTGGDAASDETPGFMRRLRNRFFPPKPFVTLEPLSKGLDMARADLVLTVTRHEMKATNYGAIDLATRKRLAGTLRKFAAFTAPPR